MAFRFCANLNFMFCENSPSILDKFRLARAAGFRGVEIPCPDTVDVQTVENARKENELEVALMNISLGQNPPNGTQFGCSAVPGQENFFQENFRRTLDYAKALNCKKIHIMAGKPPSPDAPDADATYLRNLRFASDLLESSGIIGLIEPINNYSLPGYYLNSYEKALRTLRELNSNNIKLMVDLFHLQLIKGNITNTLNDLRQHIGHVQVAQVPDRHEPSTPGEVNFKFVFKKLEDVGYSGWIGCEYKPSGDSKDNLEWINDYGYSF